MFVGGWRWLFVGEGRGGEVWWVKAVVVGAGMLVNGLCWGQVVVCALCHGCVMGCHSAWLLVGVRMCDWE